MMTVEKMNEVLKELQTTDSGYTAEELREMLRALDASLLIVLRGIAEVTDNDSN